MQERRILCAGNTAAARYVYTYLQKSGLQVAKCPSPEVTDLVLDVPSFEASGNLRYGGSLEKLLEPLPKSITVYGGNLNHPALEGYRKVDLLKDAGYLAENAYITAECTLVNEFEYFLIFLLVLEFPSLITCLYLLGI